MLEYEITIGVLTFCANNIRRKNPILELWLINYWTNQNAEFFKAQYFTNEAKYETHFFMWLEIREINKGAESF